MPSQGNQLYLAPSTLGCNTVSLTGITLYTDPKKMMGHFVERWRYCGHHIHDTIIVIYGDRIARPIGQDFADFIVKNKLGEVTASEVGKNYQHNEKEHTGNKVWCWVVDMKALNKWGKDILEKWGQPIPQPVMSFGTGGIGGGVQAGDGRNYNYAAHAQFAVPAQLKPLKKAPVKKRRSILGVKF